MRHANIQYEDRIISIDEWPTYKWKVPNYMLPALKMPCGKMQGESEEIAKYISKRSGSELWPKDKEKQEAASRIFKMSNSEPLNHIMDYVLNKKDVNKKNECVSSTIETLDTLEP